MKMSPAVAKLGGQFGDTTYTKVFVGGLAWETQSETMKKYFDQFGEILEAVVITDKATGRSKGYGFVTFREAEAARKACEDAAPVIDGRRANCNIASFGAVQRSKPSTPKHSGGEKNMRVMMNTFQKAAGFNSTTSFTATPHYAIPQGIPVYNFLGYRTYSSDYTYPSNYYNNVYGASVHGSGAAFFPYLQQPAGLGSCYTTCGVQQYPAHYLYGNYSSAGGFPQHYATAPMSLAPVAMSLPSSGMMVALQAPVPTAHC